MINQYISRHAVHAVIDMDHDNENLFILLGCSPVNGKQVTLNPIPNDQIEFGGMQNILEILFPVSFSLNVSDKS